MAKTALVAVRMGDALLASMAKEIELHNGSRSDRNGTLEEWSVTEFVRKAVHERIAKLARSRKSRARTREAAGDTPTPAAEQIVQFSECAACATMQPAGYSCGNSTCERFIPY